MVQGLGDKKKKPDCGASWQPTSSQQGFDAADWQGNPLKSTRCCHSGVASKCLLCSVFVLFEPQRCLLKKLVRFNAPIRGLDGLDMEAGALMGMSLFTTTQ